jgi:hypothetical protein
VLISDLANNSVRKVAAAGGVITTIAGNGGNGGTVFNCDGIAATAATLLNLLWTCLGWQRQPIHRRRAQ